MQHNCSISNIFAFFFAFSPLSNSLYLFLINLSYHNEREEHIFIQKGTEGSKRGGGTEGRGGVREVDFRLPLQFQERMQLIMIRDVPGKGQLKLQQA